MDKEEQAEMKEQEGEETTPLVRKSRNGGDSKVIAVDGEVSNGVSESNGHAIQFEFSQNGAENEEVITPAAEEQKIEESDRVLENEIEFINGEQKIEEGDGVLENELEFINGEQKIEEEGDKVLENKSELINGEQKIEESDGVLENELEFINREHKIEEEGDRVLENKSEFINGKQKIEESDGILETESEFINGEQKIEESNGILENKSDFINGEQKIVESDGLLEIEPEAINGELKPENLVFHDKDEGVETTPTYIVVEQLLKGPGHIKFDVSSLDFDVQNNSGSKINDRFVEEIEEENGISSPNLQHSDSSSEVGERSHYEPSREIKSAEVDVINEDDLEIAELDVERVIQKQTTHDLYCPNCKSCITKRVILRKRKRRIRILDEDVKRNKTGTAVGPKLGTVSTQSPEDQVHQEGEVGIDDAQEPTVDEDGRDREPDLFRCLSCFSFFIPTGDGFKLFKKNWFTNIFAPNKHETAVQQGSGSRTNVQQGYTAIPSSDSVHQSGQPSFLEVSEGLEGNTGINITHVSEGLEETTESKATHGDRNKALTFPNLRPFVKWKPATAVGGKLDMKATEAADATIQQFDVFSADQLMDSKPIQEVHINRDIDQLPKQIEEENKPNQTMQPGDKEVVQLSQPSVSVIQASDVNGNLNISVSIPHEEQDVTATIVTKSVLENKNVDSRSSDSGEVSPAEVPQQIITETKIEVHPNEPIKTEIISALLDAPVAKGNDTVITIDRQPPAPSHIAEGIILPTAAATASQSETQASTADRGEERKIEVIKSMVYGGLAESITSLSVVSSAAGGGAATLNVLALGAANLIGGLFVISHNLWDLRCDRDEQVSNQITEQKDRYRELLGRRQNFVLHAVVAIISYLIFGLVSPVVYGFSFRETDDKQLKLVVAAAASLLCILTLAVAKAYVQRPPKPYLKTVLTFMILGFAVSGISYAAGQLAEQLLEKLGLFEASSAAPNLLVQEMTPVGSGWASY